MVNNALTFIVLTALPPFVQGGINLANDAMTWLIVLSGGIAAALGVYNIIKWYSADDNQKPAALKKVKDICFGAVGVVIFEAVIKLVLSYFVA